MAKEFWNERYNSPDYAYGKEPNEFFKEELLKLTPGKILLLGEGEGRNAVYAAKLGWQVDAVDFSESGKEKALNLANENSVKINYEIADILEYTPKQNHYDVIALIFIHLDESVRSIFHSKVIDALIPGGTLILEVFEKDQLEMNTGGPREADRLYTLEEIATDFIELDFETFIKENVNLTEGKYHSGNSVVIRFLGKK